MLGKELLWDICKEFKDLHRFRWVVYSFVSSNLKLRYKRSVVGIFWSMLGPGFTYLVMGTVFSILMKNDNPRYFAYVFTGATFYNLFAAIMGASPGILIGNEGYMKKIYLPKSIYFVNVLLMECVNFIFSFLTLILICLILGQISFSLSWISIPFVVVLGLFFISGIAIFLAIVAVYFRDINHILPVAMQVIFFTTPVLYFVDSVPSQYQRFLQINPFYYWIEVFRQPLFYGHFPDFKGVAIVSVLAFVSFMSGIVTLQLFNNQIVFKL